MCLESKDYTQIRNTIMVLIKVSVDRVINGRTAMASAWCSIKAGVRPGLRMFRVEVVLNMRCKANFCPR